jgi:TolB protein
MKLSFRIWLGLFAIAVCPVPCFASTAPKPLVIEVDTEETRQPIAVIPFAVKTQTPLTPAYIKQLEEILSFDLSHNGTTLCQREPGAAGSSSCQVAVEVNDLNLKAILTLPAQSLVKQRQQQLASVTVSGDLTQDRHQIHLIADAIHKTLTGHPGIAATRILYTVKRPTAQPYVWTSEIWESDYDGAKACKLTLDAGYCITPSYLPPQAGRNSGNFFYVSYTSGQSKIYLAPLRQGLGQRFSPLRGNQLMPAMTRQRNLIAFINDSQGNPDLFWQRFSPEQGLIGQAARAFETRYATQASPTFSPDGRQLAFVSNKDGTPRIYVINAPEANEPLTTRKYAKLISRRCRDNSAPSWSPDGTKIAYCAMTEGVRQLWVYDTATDREVQLTEGAGHKENPSWAPNSSMLVYNTNQGEEGELYIVALADGLPTKISSGPGQKRFPNWEPR